MAVNNMILRVQKRNFALVDFNQDKICHAILGAAKEVGGFRYDYHIGINDNFFHLKDDQAIASFLSDIVVNGLMLDERYHTMNFRPSVEIIQDTIINTLKNCGFVQIGEAYEAWRWGREWVRQGVITEKQFVGGGFAEEEMQRLNKWNVEHQCDTIEKVNELLKSDKLPNVIQQSIEIYEKKLDHIVESFIEKTKHSDVKLVIISGPSSSGKTTTTELIKQKLEENNISIIKMNIDNYFWDIDQHPVDWVSDRNYETVEALDYQLINQHLHELLEGKTIKVPYYNFKTGKREGYKEELKLEKNQVILWDSHLGICPYLTEGVHRENQFIVYIEAMNPITDSKGHRIQLTDIRMLRRMLRDSKHRNHDPIKTIFHWHYVRKGELHYIIPLRKRADAVINGGLFFDLHALKSDIDEIYPSEENIIKYEQLLDGRIRYNRVKQLLKEVTPMKDRSINVIPGNCLVREFIGGQTLSIPHND